MLHFIQCYWRTTVVGIHQYLSNCHKQYHCVQNTKTKSAVLVASFNFKIEHTRKVEAQYFDVCLYAGQAYSNITFVQIVELLIGFDLFLFSSKTCSGTSFVVKADEFAIQDDFFHEAVEHLRVCTYIPANETGWCSTFSTTKCNENLGENTQQKTVTNYKPRNPEWGAGWVSAKNMVLKHAREVSKIFH